MKKGLKIWLIVWWSLLVAWWAWAWLTKTWVIPNWLGIEALCPWDQWLQNNRIIPSDTNKPTTSQNDDNYTHPQKNDDNCTCNIRENIWLPACEDCWGCSCDVGIAAMEFGGNICNDCWGGYYKPIIYLYPTTKAQINVKLWTPENLSHTYPKYNTEKWRNVIAQPNGDLEDMDTWRKLYALYREWKSDNETNFDEWFVVAWKDIVPFLEEKLATLWLNEREAEEFIVYWLPQMEGNKYNLIRFETIEEQNENMLLNIIPTPDTVIRVMMDWKAIDEPIDIPQQHLTTPERNGFTVVEWWWSPRN